MRTATNLLCAASLTAALLTGNRTAAQAFEEGTNAINVGIGIGGYRYSYASLSTGTYRSSPAFTISFDRGLKQLGPDVLGVGGFIGYKTVKYEYDYSNIFGYSYHYDRRWSNLVIGARASYHLNWWHGNDKLDLYGGVMLGYNIGSYSDKSTRTYNGVTSDYDDGVSYTSSFATYSAFAGARYLFTEKFGVYGELGYGISYLNAGLTLML